MLMQKSTFDTLDFFINSSRIGNMKNNHIIISVFILFMLVSVVSAAAPKTIDGDYPWIRVNPIGDHYVGEIFTISGTTNLLVDSDFIFEILPLALQQPGVTPGGEYSGLSETLKAVKGDTCNEWSVDVDTSSLNPDEYVVNVESVETTSTATTSFNLLEKGATATATKTAAKTTTATMATTPAATEKATLPISTRTEAAAPGFGALVALAGAGAAAGLLIRKD